MCMCVLSVLVKGETVRPTLVVLKIEFIFSDTDPLLVLLKRLIHFHINEGRDSPFDFGWISGYYCEICLLLWLLLSVSPILQHRKFLFLNVAHQVIWLDFIAPQLSETVPYYLYFFKWFQYIFSIYFGPWDCPFLVYVSGVIWVSSSYSSSLVILLLAIITLERFSFSGKHMKW